MSDQLREAAQAALEAVETVLNDAYHRRFPECCGRPQGYECCGDWNEARTPDDNRIMDLLSPVQRQLSETLRAALAERKPEPIAWVPVHPRIGPLWAMTTDAPDPERLPSYPLMPLYAHPPRREWVGLTEEQKIAKRDPILFGLIENVRKLYFIGDWKDEECDLTMEEVARILGHPTSEINPDPTVEP